MPDPPYAIHARLSLTRRAAGTWTLARLHAPIEREIRAAGGRAVQAERSGDREREEGALDDEWERVEELLGLAFIAAQSFITGVRNRVVTVYESGTSPRPSFCSDAKGYTLLTMGSPLRRGASYTAVEAINAVANYSKHQDDWRTREEKKGRQLVTVWEPRANERRTSEIATDLGMAPYATGNIRTAAKKLGIKEFRNLAPVREELRFWAERVYEAVRAHIAP